ncbi:hypothetical protein MtrunA17_Chr3g0134351 [Medicago truncatula]|uniref:Uncharacterized protein n=1 Tax=Medicago truncatula TaxID=3880 RepID=A0A396J510_MEDTR|nr:hypothetical protein MtrunA17_Chr3g0134351 [Medicago truncatula]
MKTKKNMMTMMMFEALKEVKDKVNEDDEIHQEQEQQIVVVVHHSQC